MTWSNRSKKKIQRFSEFSNPKKKLKLILPFCPCPYVYIYVLGGLSSLTHTVRGGERKRERERKEKKEAEEKEIKALGLGATLRWVPLLSRFTFNSLWFSIVRIFMSGVSCQSYNFMINCNMKVFTWVSKLWNWKEFICWIYAKVQVAFWLLGAIGLNGIVTILWKNIHIIWRLQSSSWILGIHL